MDLKTFVTDTLLQIGKDLEYADMVCKEITEYARKKAINNCAVISDDEVRNFIVKYDYDKNTFKLEPKAKPEPKIIEKVNDEKHDSFVQTSLL